MLVPVDLHLPDARLLKPGVDEMLDRVEAEGLRYCQLDLANIVAVGPTAIAATAGRSRWIYLALPQLILSK